MAPRIGYLLPTRERVEDPAQIGDAILRARRQNEDGKAALLEFITSQEQGFSHRRGAAE